MFRKIDAAKPKENGFEINFIPLFISSMCCNSRMGREREKMEIEIQLKKREKIKIISKTFRKWNQKTMKMRIYYDMMEYSGERNVINNNGEDGKRHMSLAEHH